MGKPIHPAWSRWYTLCGYSSWARAALALQVSRSTMYRRIKRPPGERDRLAMTVIYHRLTPWPID